MTFQEQEQFTKKNSDDLLTELSNYQGENLISEIVRLGIQNLMELERDEHIGVCNYVEKTVPLTTLGRNMTSNVRPRLPRSLVGQ